MKKILLSFLFGVSTFVFASEPQVIKNMMILIGKGFEENSLDGISSSFTVCLDQNKSSLFVSQNIVKNVFTYAKYYKKVEESKKYHHFHHGVAYSKQLYKQYIKNAEKVAQLNNQHTALSEELNALLSLEEKKDLLDKLEANKRDFQIHMEILSASERTIKAYLTEEGILRSKGLKNIVRDTLSKIKFDFDKWNIYQVGGDYLFLLASEKHRKIPFKKIDNEKDLAASLNSIDRPESKDGEGSSEIINLKKVFETLSDSNTAWNIYLQGHGYTVRSDKNFSIVGLHSGDFKILFTYFVENINTNFLYYTTCFGGGKVAQQILKWIREGVKYSFKEILGNPLFAFEKKKLAPVFPIVTGSILDGKVFNDLDGGMYDAFFGALEEHKGIHSKEEVLKVMRLLDPSIDLCPDKYTAEKIINFYPGVLLPGGSAFIPLSICDALLLVTEDQSKGDLPFVVDDSVKAIMFEVGSFERKITIQATEMPKFLMVQSGNSTVNLAEIEVEPSSPIHLSDFFKAFIESNVLFEKTYIIKTVLCPLSSHDKNFDLLKDYVDSEGVVTLSNVVIKRNLLGVEENPYLSVSFTDKQGRVVNLRGNLKRDNVIDKVELLLSKVLGEV